jgi:hypothetical protein
MNPTRRSLFAAFASLTPAAGAADPIFGGHINFKREHGNVVRKPSHAHRKRMTYVGQCEPSRCTVEQLRPQLRLNIEPAFFIAGANGTE